MFRYHYFNRNSECGILFYLSLDDAINNHAPFLFFSLSLFWSEHTKKYGNNKKKSPFFTIAPY